TFLTTIRQPFETLGVEAARLLRHRVETGGSGPYRHTMLEARLIVRDSSKAHRREPGRIHSRALAEVVDSGLLESAVVSG
ncbi:MAG TPA: substrate-binding domain-containing protein, partial [Chthonomonadales bacterium]|nr:substrate-binding domain-containing protein [Chthonomonadales bacterium]